jgi:L-ribulose-5-phosphate 3-epimerase
MPVRMSRRELLTGAATLAAARIAAGAGHQHAPAGTRRFHIGACDWSIGMRGRVEALALTRDLGLDGAQISMGSVDNDLHLRHAEVQRAYRDAAAEHGVRVGGVALDVMNRVPYKSDPRTIEWVHDSIDVAQALGVRVVLLAFFEQGDLRDDRAGQAEVVRRLKEAAPKAETHGVILGIESWLPAADHVRLLDAVGSPNVQVYFDVANSHQMGYDIYAEIRQLGRERVCEIHAKENGALLGRGDIDFRAVRAALDDIGYAGWLQIEGSIPKGTPMIEAYIENARFLRALFGA